MVIPVKVKTSGPKWPMQAFTSREMEEIAGCLEVVLLEGTELVHFGQLPPANLRLRWQELDVTGAMVGQVKSWSGSVWV